MDLNTPAEQIVDEATSDAEEPRAKGVPGKHPAAVALGRLGGLKGGPSRALSLSPEERSAIAKKAAAARWKSRS